MEREELQHFDVNLTYLGMQICCISPYQITDIYTYTYDKFPKSQKGEKRTYAH